MFYPNGSRLRSYLFLVVILCLAAGSCQPHLTFVPVREKDLTFGPVDLPLQAADREQLVIFLKKGADRAVRSEPYPAAGEFYSGLLDRLGDGAFVGDINNFADPDKAGELAAPVKPWLEGPLLVQVVDAKQERPFAIMPLAAVGREGPFVWIFLRPSEGDIRRVNELVVTRNILGDK